MADERRLDAVVLTVDGSELAVDVLDRLSMIRVEESVHLPDTFLLRFDDPHFALFDDEVFTLGTAVDVALRAEGDPITVTAGEVTAISVEQSVGGRHELVLHGMDRMHRLGRVRRTRSYQQVTDADIAERIARDHGLDTEVDATDVVHDHVLQAHDTDAAFLRARARRVGYQAWVTGTTLHFKPAPTATADPPALVWGDNLHRWRVRFSAAEHAEEVVVQAWNPLDKQAIEGRSEQGTPLSTPPAAAELAGDAATAFGDTVRSATLPVGSGTEADVLAGALMGRAAGCEVLARGEAAGHPMLAAGAEVDVARVGSRLSGTYRLTSVEHLYGPGTPYVTRFTCGGKDPASLPDLLSGAGVPRVGGRPASWTGFVVGIVTNVDDSERLGRVRVSLPTIGADDETAWARLVTPGAGTERGLQLVPEVDDEVLVGFEHGDVARPVVLGGLWSRASPPPAAEAVSDGEVAERTWRSRTGSHITIRDGDSGTVTLEAPHGDVEIIAGATLKLTAANIQISADGELTQQGDPIRLN